MKMIEEWIKRGRKESELKKWEENGLYHLQLPIFQVTRKLMQGNW